MCLRKRRRCEGSSAVHNHLRLRVREDGENPSPPRDCKAEVRRSVPLSKPPNLSDSVARWEGRAVAPISLGRTAKSGDRRSLNPGAHAGVRVGTTFNSRARGRGGDYYETAIFCFAVFCNCTLFHPHDIRTNNKFCPWSNNPRKCLRSRWARCSRRHNQFDQFSGRSFGDTDRLDGSI